MSTETIHLCPPKDSGLMPCCNRTPFEVPRTDRMTLERENCTCTALVDEVARLLWQAEKSAQEEATAAIAYAERYEDEPSNYRLICRAQAAAVVAHFASDGDA